jgi:hypothetical protein
MTRRKIGILEEARNPEAPAKGARKSGPLLFGVGGRASSLGWLGSFQKNRVL